MVSCPRYPGRNRGPAQIEFHQPLTPRFDVQRGNLSSEAQGLIRHCVATFPAAARSAGVPWFTVRRAASTITTRKCSRRAEEHQRRVHETRLQAAVDHPSTTAAPQRLASPAWFDGTLVVRLRRFGFAASACSAVSHREEATLCLLDSSHNRRHRGVGTAPVYEH